MLITRQGSQLAHLNAMLDCSVLINEVFTAIKIALLELNNLINSGLRCV